MASGTTTASTRRMQSRVGRNPIGPCSMTGAASFPPFHWMPSRHVGVSGRLVPRMGRALCPSTSWCRCCPLLPARSALPAAFGRRGHGRSHCHCGLPSSASQAPERRRGLPSPRGRSPRSSVIEGPRLPTSDESMMAVSKQPAPWKTMEGGSREGYRGRRAAVTNASRGS